MDPGTITLTGPGPLAVTLKQQLAGAYSSVLPAGAIPSTGGTFTFMGSGGGDVGSFTSSVTFANPVFNWTNPGAAATISKTQGFTATWSGGNAGTAVFIGGTSPNVLGAQTAFTCRAPVEAGKFTVPPYILLGMPSGSGAVNFQNDTYGTLKATGLDDGGNQATISFSAPASFQ